MRRLITGIAVLGTLACGLFAAVGADRDSDQPQTSPEQKRMVEAAQKAYEASMAMWQVGAGGVTLEGIYTWSRRWAEAAAEGARPGDRLHAYMLHCDRMRDLLRAITDKHNEGIPGGELDKFEAAKFYLAEAEYLQIKKKAAPDNQ
jgi:hypothetical protein